MSLPRIAVRQISRSAAWTKGNQSTIDGLVNEIGNYSGTTAYGLTDMGNAPVKLQITADGSWTIKIAPISSARVFPASISGKGDAVFKFEGDAADFAITHNGSSNFTVQQYGGEQSMGRERDREVLRHCAVRGRSDSSL